MNSFGLGFRLSNVACAKIGKLGKLPHTPTLYHFFSMDIDIVGVVPHSGRGFDIEYFSCSTCSYIDI